MDTAISQQRAPPVPVLRKVPPHLPPTHEPPRSSQPPPPLSQAFPLALSSHLHASPKSAATTSAYPLKPAVPFTSSPCTFLPLVSPTATPAKSRPVQLLPMCTQLHAPGRTPSAQYQMVLPTHPLASQRPMPLVGHLRAISQPSALASGTLISTQYSPLLLRSFPLAPQSFPSVSPPPASQQSAPLVPPPHHAQSSPALTPAHSVPLPTMLIPVQAHPFMLLHRKGDTRPPVQVYIPVCAAPIIESLCDVPLPSMPIQVTSAPVQFPLPPVQAFLTPPEHVQLSQPSLIDATLDVLAKTIATLKRAVESLLGNPSSPGSCREQSEDMSS